MPKFAPLKKENELMKMTTGMHLKDLDIFSLSFMQQIEKTTKTNNQKKKNKKKRLVTFTIQQTYEVG